MSEVLPSPYVDRVNDVLRDDADRWGELLLKRPDGPTLDATKDLLVPANVSDGLTGSGFHYLPLTYPKPSVSSWHTVERAFSLHVADGSSILSDWDKHSASQTVTFSVGADASEVYGSVRERFVQPELSDGYLPMLRNTYVDATGARFERESFTARIGGELVSHVKFSVRPEGGATKLRLNLVAAEGIAGVSAQGNVLGRHEDRSIVAFSPGARWESPDLEYEITEPREVYLVIANRPALAHLKASAEGYDAARTLIADYWRGVLAGGAEVTVPEKYAADAMRNLLIQNLVSGWQLSIGNGYESTSENFAYPPEASAAVTSFGQFGYGAEFRENLQALLHRTQGAELGGNWVRAVNLQNAARYYFLTNDASYVRDNLATFTSYLDTMRRQVDGDPNGLLAKEKYGADLHETVYGFHHQAETWRGLRDLGLALRQMGETSTAAAFTQLADRLREAVLNAVTASQTWLPDGSLYIPIPLLEPAARTPFDSIAASRDGSYYNLTIPFALATGILPADSAWGVRDYITKHGGMLVGLTRFNLPGVDPGVCESGGVAPFGNAPGYRGHGVDEQYGYSWARHLSDAQQSDQLTLLLYGKLGQDLTPGTFVGGEGTSVAPCPEMGEHYRTQFRPPMAGNNAVYLQTVRSILVAETVDTAGVPRELTIAPATPRRWLADGKTVAAKRLPTVFGPVSFEVRSQLSQQKIITAAITAPTSTEGRFRAETVKVVLRAPAGHRLVSATVDGITRPIEGETVDLGAFTGTANVEARYESAPVADPDLVAPVALSIGRGVVRRGATVALSGQVEAIGSAAVRGTVSVGAPAGWVVRNAETPFTLESNGKVTWHGFKATVAVPPTTPAGEHDITVTTTPQSGAGQQRKVRVRVATAASGSYESLVKSQRPTAYWRLGDTGRTAADSSPYGTHGTYQDNVIRGESGAIAQDSNTAVRLNGGFVEVPHALPVTPSAPYSQEAWIKVTTSGQQGLIEKYDRPGHNGFVLRLVTGNKLRAETLAGPGTTASAVTGRTTVLPGSWHHVVSTYDGTRLSVYLDGRLEAQLATSQYPKVGSGTLKLGARGDDAGYRLSGSIDEIALYDYALSPAQIDAHYLKGVLG